MVGSVGVLRASDLPAGFRSPSPNTPSLEITNLPHSLCMLFCGNLRKLLHRTFRRVLKGKKDKAASKVKASLYDRAQSVMRFHV